MKVMRLIYFIVVFMCGMSLQAQDKLTFTIFSDIHQDIIPNAGERLDVILRNTEKNRSSFVIQLGDFAINRKSNDDIVAKWLDYPIEKYSVLGNHDLDIGTKEQYIKYMKMPAPYYFFDKGIYRFVVLDTNFILDDNGNEVDYANSNYYGKTNNRISKPQLNWVEELLTDKSLHYIFLAHTAVDGSLHDNPSLAEFRRILEKAHENGVRIAAVFGGHFHMDYHVLRNGINYLQLNSASYLYVGNKYTNKTRYPEAEYKRSPTLADTAPYKDALYGIVNLDPKKQTITLKGVKSSFIKPSPQDLGVEPEIDLINRNVVPYSATVSNIKYRY